MIWKKIDSLLCNPIRLKQMQNSGFEFVKSYNAQEYYRNFKEITTDLNTKIVGDNRGKKYE